MIGSGIRAIYIVLIQNGPLALFGF